MAYEEFKAHLRKNIEEAGSDYLKDLEAMSDEQLSSAPGGIARPAFDFTYEVVTIHKRIAMRLRGEDPGPAAFDGWMVAPEEFRSKTEAINSVQTSVAEILDAFDAFPSDRLLEKIPLPKGETSALDLAHMVAFHMGYHDAQLNYIQAIHGDGEVHW